MFFSPIFCNIVDKIYDNDRKIHYGGRYAYARDIAPLNMSLIVEHGAKTILKRWVEINPWSGDNIELNLKG